MSIGLTACARGVPSDRASPIPALLAAAVIVALAVPAAAQPQFQELAKRGLPASTAATMATAQGDVDGDGDLDLVVGNIGQSRLYLSNGTGAFSDVTATRMPVGNEATFALALGDVDGDGDLDMVVGNWGQSRLYQNNGAGTFTDVTTTRLPVGIHNTIALQLGDVDGDGDLDLVVGNSYQQSRLYLNSGTGTFSDATATRMPAAYDYTTSLQLGDVDGDGDLDLLLGSSYQRNRLYLNNGAGTFADATTARMPVGIYYTTSLALGDVDGDGDLDLVVGNRSGFQGQQSRLYLNNGTGTFTDATATRLPNRPDDRTLALQLGDVDGDGDLDLVLGNQYEQSRLYLNNGTGTFLDASASRMPVGTCSTTSLTLGDVDGDGDLDLVLGNRSQQSRLYLNNGTGTFADATAPHLPVGNYHAQALAQGDVDGDGDLDLVFGNQQTQNRLYLNNGMGTFRDATATHMPIDSNYTSSLVLGDVDGDGDLDLVVGSGTYSPNLLYLNNGAGVFTDATIGRMPLVTNRTSSLQLGDVDGDGDLDLALGNLNQSRLYLNNGTGTFTDATAARMPVGSYTTSLALGDVDGDGDLDMVLGNNLYATGEQSRLYLNNGLGTFTDVTATRMPLGSYFTSSVALGDVDRDGDLDLVLGNLGFLTGQQSRLYVNNGAGTFSDATATRMPVAFDTTTSVALGDVDGDGDLDLVLGNNASPYGQQSRLYLNNGTGTFSDATATRMPFALDATNSVVLGDVDGDGDLDLLLGNYITGNAQDLQQSRLYQNLQRQLDAPFVLHVGRTYRLDVYSRHGAATQLEFAIPYFSTATAHIPLPPLGTLGIDPSQMILLPPFVVPQPAGLGSLGIQVPNQPALVGITIYTQALLQQIPGQLHLTNVVGDVILR